MTARSTTLPHAVKIMAAICLLGAAGCLLGVIAPMDDHAPVGLMAALAALGAALGTLDLVLGVRVPSWALHVQLVIVAVSASALVARSQTGVGAMTTTVAFPWFGVYAAIVFSRRWALAHAVLLTAGLVVGLLACPADLTVTAVLVVTVSLWSAVLSIASVMRRLDRLAATDPLTGLLNRTGLAAAARREMARAARSGEPLTLLAIDLDDLKAVNDREGHLQGDRLLSSAARAWSSALRGQDALARLGGDEFVVLAPGTSEDQAATLVERLRAAHPARWSVGVRSWQPGEPFDAWLERADRALYEEKARRRDGRSAVPASP
jgi:diguanylate cyclase (GGDEF)-like protein